MNRKLPVIAVLLLSAAPAFAGLTFRQVTKSEGEKGRSSESETAVSLDDKNARIDMTRMENNPMMRQGFYMLVKDDGATMLMVNPTDKTYARFDPAAMMQGMEGGMRQPQQGGMKMDIEDAKSEKLLEEPGPPILGYATRHLRFHRTWTMVIGTEMMSIKNATDSIEDVWVTDAIALPKFGHHLGKLNGGFFAQLEKAFGNELEKAQGFPLKRVIASTSKMSGMPMLGGAGGKSTSTIEVLEVKEGAVPAVLFEIPPGYRETEVQQRGPARPDQQKKPH